MGEGAPKSRSVETRFSATTKNLKTERSKRDGFDSLENRFHRRARFHSFHVLAEAGQRWIGQNTESFQSGEARNQVGIDQREIAHQILLIADFILKALQELLQVAFRAVDHLLILLLRILGELHAELLIRTVEV